MKVVTSTQMRKIDEETIQKFGIPAVVLMGYAGKIAANYILDEFPHIENIAVVCGAGNNGGDGLVIAYLLSNSKKNVKVFLAGDEEKISETSRIYFNLCKNANVPILPLTDENANNLAKSELIVDAVVGTGFRGKATGKVAHAITAINKSNGIIVSIDVPSGLPSDGETPEGEVVKANVTIAIGLPKISLVTYPGKRYVGKLVLADIGFPQSLCESDELKVELIDEGYVCRHFSSDRDVDAHKNTWEQVLFVGGFDGMEGALLLSALAFFEMGGSMATALTTENARIIIAGKIPELITASIATGTEWHALVQKCSHAHSYTEILDDVKNLLITFFSNRKKFPVAIIGPGMGRGLFARAVFKAIIDNATEFGITRMIIDGDGLFHFAHHIQEKKQLLANAIITPHFLEAARICGKSVEEIKNNRFKIASELSKLCGTIVLLKGPATIVTDGIKSLINTTGNPALATGGSGDVLCGIIASLACRGIGLLEAAALGTWFHGRAADLYVNSTGKDTMKASDIIAQIGETIRNVRTLQAQYKRKE